MTRRFPPPRVGLPSSRDRYDIILGLLADPKYSPSKEEFAKRCQEAINQREPEADLSESWAGRMVNDLLRSGFIREVGGSENTAVIELDEDAERYVQGEIEFEKCLFRALRRGWVLKEKFPEGMEALEKILRVVLYDADGPVSSKWIKDRLKDDYDYGFSRQGIRGYVPLLVYYGALKETEDGLVPTDDAENKLGNIRNANVFHQLEKWLRRRGPLEDPPSKRAKQALMKYYMYRESGGWSKRRRWHTVFARDYLKLGARRGNADNPTLDRKEKYVDKEKEEDQLVDQLEENFGFDREELHGLAVKDLRRIADSEDRDQAMITRIRVGSGVSRADFVDLINEDRPYAFGPDFELYEWQKEAADRWFEGAGEVGPLAGISEVVTGAGKTVLALEIIRRWLDENEDGVVTVVVPTRVLMYQWLAELSSKLNVPVDELGWAGDGTRHTFDDGIRVLVTIVNTAVKDDYLQRQLDAVDRPEHLLIADECHRYTGDVHSNVLTYHSTATLGLSATPTTVPTADRNENPSESEKVLFEELGGLYYSLTYDEAIEQNLIAPFEIRYVGFDLSTEERQQYDSLTREISDAVSDLKARYGNRLFELNGTFQQKLNVIRKTDDSSHPVIGKFFSLTDERRDLIEEAVARQAITLDLLEGLEEGTKTIVFQEQIEQLEEMVAPKESRGITREGTVVERGNNYRSAKYAKYPLLEQVDERMEQLFADPDYWPVMYHSGHSRDVWNQFAMEWFRADGYADVMYSVKALIEGVDVPEVDVGIIRVSSGSVRQRIQTLGRILRRGDDTKNQAMLYVLYARDTVDENIFRNYDWEAQLGNAELTHCYWKTTESILDGEIVEIDEDLPKIEEFEEPEFPDSEALSIGDPYDGPRRGYTFSVDADGNPFEKSASGRRFIVNSEIERAAKFVHREKGGGRITINERGHMVTMLPDGPVFLGVTEGPEAFEYEGKNQISLTDEPPDFEELF